MEKHSLYGGKIELTFDPIKHLYHANGKVTYGVTSVKDVIAKPALMYWAVNVAVEQMRRDFKPGVAYDELQVEQFLDSAKTAHRKRTQEAASIGQLAHGWISDYVMALANGKPAPDLPVNERAKSAVNAFLEFTKKHNITITSSERKIYSIESDYAGTLDAEGMVDGVKCVIDFKTSSGIYPEYFIQTAAYVKAREEETGEKYGGALIVRIDKDTGMFEAKAIKRDSLERFYKAFEACLVIYRLQMELKDEEKKAKEEQVEMKFDKYGEPSHPSDGA